MRTHVTYCRICEAACGLLADVEGGRVVALRPDPDHVVSRGFACAKGTRFAAVHEDPDRVDHPLQRVNGRLERVSWHDAVTRAGAALRGLRERHGPHSVAVYVGNPAAFSATLPLAGMGFVRALGTRNYFNAGSLDCNNKFVTSRAMLGSPAIHPVPDLDHARFALLLGTNPSVSQSSFVNAPRMMERLKAIEQRGGEVVVVDPRRTETARSVGRHVPIVPEMDAALLLAMIHVVLSEGLEQPDVVERTTNGASALRRLSARFTPDRVAAATGVPADTLRELARRFAAAGGAFCHLSTGVNQGRFGTVAYGAKIALEAITGNLDAHGGALVPHGAADVAGLAHRFGIDREPGWTSRIGGFSPVLGAMPCGIFADEVLTPGEGQIRGLVCIAGNPLLSMPGGPRLEAALRSLETVVSLDLFVNDTAAFAHWVLPSTDWLERDDLPYAQLQLQPVPYVQWTEAVVRPRGERRGEWDVLFDLADATGVPMFGRRALHLAGRAAARLGGTRAVVLPSLVRALGPRPLRTLRANPHGLLVDRERPGSFLAKRVLTRSGRVELCPDGIFDRADELESELDHRAAGTLRLFTKRERLGHNSWMHNHPGLTTRPHAAHLAPSDAARLGISSGDRVRVTSSSGAIELIAEVSDDVLAGSVAVPHGYGHHAGSGWTHARARGGANVNALADTGPDSVDPVSGMSRFVGVRVQMERVDATVEADDV